MLRIDNGACARRAIARTTPWPIWVILGVVPCASGIAAINPAVTEVLPMFRL
jgi:hypothetical protein